MADLIKIKGGSGDVPTLQDRELAYRRDEKALYIGTKDGNVRLCGIDELVKIADIYAKIDNITTQLSELHTRLEALEAPTETPSE